MKKIVSKDDKKVKIYDNERNLKLSLLLIFLLCISWFLIYPYTKHFTFVVFVILMFMYSWLLKKADKKYSKYKTEEKTVI